MSKKGEYIIYISITILNCFKREKQDLKQLIWNYFQKILWTVQSISRKYRVDHGVQWQSAEIFTGAFSSEDTGCVVGRRHACHAPDLSRRAAGVHEAPDTSDNNLFRSDSAGTMPPPRIADPARYVIGCCSCCFSRRGLLSFSLPSVLSETPFLLARCPSCLCDTELDFSLHSTNRDSFLNK